MDDRMDRVSVAEAASRLGITSDAIRQRIRRGTIAHERDKDGSVYVYLHAGDTGQDNSQDTTKTALALMQEQVDYLRSQLEVWQEEARRKDHIIAALTERIPELEPAAEPSDTRQTPGEGPDRVGGPAPNADEPERRSSW